jgi:hypothetical protein
MLETFDRYNTNATFFVECANYFYFGDEPMQGVVKRIQAARQDVQLHVHPVWLSFNQDPSGGRFPAPRRLRGAQLRRAEAGIQYLYQRV